MKMRVLWLAAGLLLPLDKGGKLRTWHLLRHLSSRHEVTFLGFAPPGVAPDVVHGMRRVCANVVTVPRGEPGKGSLRFYARAALRLADPLPFAVGTYRSRRYRAALRHLLDHERFDAVVCDFLVPAVNMPGTVGCPSVLFTHNVEAEIWRRHAETAPGRLRRILLSQQWRRMARFERLTIRRFDTVLAVSEADRRTLVREYGPPSPGQRIHVIPTGVDTEYFTPTATPPAEPHHLVFTGSMDWLPNEDAARHFCEDVLPRIRAQVPDVTLSLVGRRPTPAVRLLGERVPGVQVTGTVDDVRPHLARAAAVVVPLRIGGGTRLKIFEAMAMGKAVVSTSVGAEGLPLRSGEDALIADTPSDFATAVVGLLRDEPRRTALGDAARALVSGRYDWGAAATVLESALVEAVNHPRRPAAAEIEVGAHRTDAPAGSPARS